MPAQSPFQVTSHTLFAVSDRIKCSSLEMSARAVSQMVPDSERVGEPVSPALLSGGGVGINFRLSDLLYGTDKPFAVDEFYLFINIFY